MSAAGDQARADIAVIRDAAVMLDEESLHLRLAHTLGPEHTDWDDDLGAKECYDDMKIMVGKLHTLADRLEADLRRPDPLGYALNSGDGVYRP